MYNFVPKNHSQRHLLEHTLCENNPLPAPKWLGLYITCSSTTHISCNSTKGNKLYRTMCSISIPYFYILGFDHTPVKYFQMYISRAQNCVILIPSKIKTKGCLGIKPRMRMLGVYCFGIELRGGCITIPSFNTFVFDFLVTKKCIILRWPIKLPEPGYRESIRLIPNHLKEMAEIEAAYPRLRPEAPPYSFFTPTVDIHSPWKAPELFVL